MFRSGSSITKSPVASLLKLSLYMQRILDQKKSITKNIMRKKTIHEVPKHLVCSLCCLKTCGSHILPLAQKPRRPDAANIAFGTEPSLTHLCRRVQKMAFHACFDSETRRRSLIHRGRRAHRDVVEPKSRVFLQGSRNISFGGHVGARSSKSQIHCFQIKLGNLITSTNNLAAILRSSTSISLSCPQRNSRPLCHRQGWPWPCYSVVYAH